MPTIFWPRNTVLSPNTYTTGYGTTDLNLLLDINFNVPNSVNISQGTTDTNTSTNDKQYTNGISTADGGFMEFITKPLNAFTLSGNITFRFFASENNNQANASMRARIYKYDSNNVLSAALATTSINGELTTSLAGYFITAAPTSTNFLAGDKILLRYFVIAAPGTTIGGATRFTTLGSQGTGSSTDFYVNFTETISVYDKLRFVSSTG